MIEVRVAQKHFVYDVNILTLLEIQERLDDAQAKIHQRMANQSALRAPLHQRIRDIGDPIRVFPADFIAVGARMAEFRHPGVADPVDP